MTTTYTETNLTHATGFGVNTETGLALSNNLPYEEWARLGPEIVKQGEMAPFKLGDWINFGERSYGEKYTQAVTLLEGRYKPGTLVNLASVARRIPAERRRPNLSYRHHTVVAYQEPEHADKFLAEAERTGMTSNELRDMLREVKLLPPPTSHREKLDLSAEGKEALDYLEGHLVMDRSEIVNELLIERAAYSREGVK